MPACYEFCRTHLDLATLASVEENPEMAAMHLTEAHTLFETSQTTTHAEQPAQPVNDLALALATRRLVALCNADAMAGEACLSTVDILAAMLGKPILVKRNGLKLQA
jgi:hypothetical protein